MRKLGCYLTGSILFTAANIAFAATGASLSLTTLTTTVSNISTGAVISSDDRVFNTTTLADRGTTSFPSGGPLPSITLLKGQIATLSLGYSMSAFDEGYQLSSPFFFAEGLHSALILSGEYEGSFADLLLGSCDTRGAPATISYGCARVSAQTAQDGKADFVSRSGTAVATYGLSSIGEAAGGASFTPQLFYFVQATPNGTTAPIPEPSTYALLLAGLAVVGWKRR